MLLSNFNSIKVQLERRVAAQEHLCKIYFNSIKVQLEPDFPRVLDKFPQISIP